MISSYFFRIDSIGVYVSLLEYNDIQGFIPASELSRRRIRSIPKLVQVGKIEPSVVTRVDEEKGRIHNWKVCNSL